MLALACPALAAGVPAAPVSVSPQPGTPDASPQTQISLLGVPPARLGSIAVVGSRSGTHTGQLRPYASQPGASFVPARPFEAGEQVTVTLKPKPGGAAGLTDRFTIGAAGPIGLRSPAPGELPPQPRTPPTPQTFVSRMDLRPADLFVSTNTSRPGSGDVFVAPFSVPAPGGPPPAVQHGPAIFDSHGQLVWFYPVLGLDGVLNFHRQTIDGAPALSWWQGTALVPFPGIGFGQDVVLDNSYRVIARVNAGNGYRADMHDFSIGGGRAWVPIYSPVLVNLPAELAKPAGQKQQTVLDSIFEEVDLKTGLVMFEWHSLGHVPLVDTYIQPQKNVAYDAFHVNSLEPGGDGTVLMSLRNTQAVYRISIATGKILWTLGGSRSSFRMGPGASFAWQHDAEYRPGGIVSMFDDESAPRVHPPSRGLTLKLDFASHLATVIHQYHHRPAVVTGTQGNMQLLRGGDEVLGWGAEPYVSQYTPAGRLNFDAQFQPGMESYRAFRAPWIGHPSDSPVAAVLPAITRGERVVYASWNGATQVASWDVLAGSGPGHMKIVANRPHTGFETPITVPSAGPEFSVLALGAAGQVLGASRPARP